MVKSALDNQAAAADVSAYDGALDRAAGLSDRRLRAVDANPEKSSG